jgi:hypothetical protein
MHRRQGRPRPSQGTRLDHHPRPGPIRGKHLSRLPPRSHGGTEVRRYGGTEVPPLNLHSYNAQVKAVETRPVEAGIRSLLRNDPEGRLGIEREF